MRSILFNKYHWNYYTHSLVAQPEYPVSLYSLWHVSIFMHILHNRMRQEHYWIFMGSATMECTICTVLAYT